MFIKKYEAFLDECYKEVLASKNKRIINAVQHLKKIDQDKFENMFKSVIRNFLAKSWDKFTDEKEAEAEFITLLEQMVEFSTLVQRKIVVQVKLRDLENEFYRVIEVPLGIRVSDFCYIVLASFNALGYEPVKLRHEGFDYVIPFGEEDTKDGLSAIEVPLAMLELEKWHHMTLTYGDKVDPFYFDMTIRDIVEVDHPTSGDDVIIREGKGYGVWDGEKTLMEMYYANAMDDVEAYLDKFELELDDMPYFEEFDIDVANQCLVEDALDLQNSYENPDEEDLPDFDDDFLGDLEDDDLPFLC